MQENIIQKCNLLFIQKKNEDIFLFILLHILMLNKVTIKKINR